MFEEEDLIIYEDMSELAPGETSNLELNFELPPDIITPGIYQMEVLADAMTSNGVYVWDTVRFENVEIVEPQIRLSAHNPC